MNPIYEILNPNYVQQDVAEALMKLHDFLDEADKVSPQHRNMFSGLCRSVLLDYMNKHDPR